MAFNFSGYLDQKYANQNAATQSENALRAAQAKGITGALGSENALRAAQARAAGVSADSTANLQSAQAQGITGALPSENALRGAQTFSTLQQGSTLAPLAQASIASTLGGLDQQRAQTGLLRTQNAVLGDDFTSSAPSELSQLHAGLSANGGVGSGVFSTLWNGVTKNPVAPGYAAGTPDVGSGKTGEYPVAPMQPLMKPGYAPEDPTQAMIPALNHPDGSISLHGVMAHALAALSHATLHAAGGMSSVPGPGQTITNGSWTGPMPAPAPAPAPQPGGMGGTNSGLDLARKLGMRAAGGAMDVPAGPMPTNPGGPVPAQPDPASVRYLTPGGNTGQQFGRRVAAAGGASSVGMKKGGMVPGKGAPNVDSVPAVLAPHEAVLNAGAAAHIGHGTIAALNALGAAKMAQAGMPVPPPTAHGMPAPAPAPMQGGKSAAPKPSTKPGMKPLARGMPPAKGKGPALKVAGAAKGR